MEKELQLVEAIGHHTHTKLQLTKIVYSCHDNISTVVLADLDMSMGQKLIRAPPPSLAFVAR